MSHELAARNTDAELVQKLIQSASWRITAPLRAAKLILTRLHAEQTAVKWARQLFEPRTVRIRTGQILFRLR